MCRKLFTLTAGVSAALCLGACVLWVRSYGVEDSVQWRRVDGCRRLRSAPGHIVLAMDLADWSHQPAEFYGVEYARQSPTPAEVETFAMYALNIGPRDSFVHRQWAGFAWWRWAGRGGGGSSIARLVVPLWSVVLAGALVPLGWSMSRWYGPRRRGRRRAGLCPECGYDLRATPDRCPECGRVAAVKEAAA